MKIIHFIKQFLNYIFNFKSIRQHKLWQKQIAKGILDKKQETIKVMRDITYLIKQEKYKRKTSKYIPLSKKNNEEIRYMVLSEYGKKMKFLNINVSSDLKFL